MSNFEYQFSYPTNIDIDLTRYKDIRIKYGTCVYKLDTEKLLKEFGILIEVIND